MYQDIINLPHHVSKTRPQMAILDRAAQFSPFAALTGHEAAIEEVGRITDYFVELDESRKMDLNEKLQSVIEQNDKKMEVIITYFQPDEKKSGGSYINITGVIKKIDDYEQCIILQDKSKILIKFLYDIEIKENE